MIRWCARRESPPPQSRHLLGGDRAGSLALSPAAGVKFHEGGDFTSEDVVASITRTIDPGARNRGNLSQVIGVEAVDDSSSICC